MYIMHSGPLNVKTGGPTLSTYLALKGIEKFGCKTAVITMPLAQDDKWIADDIKIYLTEKQRKGGYGFIPRFHKTLTELERPDIIHLQGLWMHLFHGATTYARKQGIPYVVSLRGNLYPQALANSSLLKYICRILFQNKDLSAAACIHATCDDELRHYRDLGFKNPVAVIPNPINSEGIIERKIPEKKEFTIGYLGRLHPRKRVERLIYAVDFLKRNNIAVKLKIIGSDNKEYEEFLKAEVARLGLNNVEFTGFLVGEEKDKAITGLSVLACASDFENFGNIVTEALVRGVPVMATKGMPWKCLVDNHCGWWIENDQETINQTLMSIAKLPANDIIDMGINGKIQIKDKFSVTAVGKQFTELYSWILEGGKVPDFVSID